MGGTTVPFGTGSNYTCKEGTFFGSDFGKTHIAIECYRNGSWEAPGLIEDLHYKYGLLPFRTHTSTFQKFGIHATPHLNDFALILHLPPLMEESLIGTQPTLEASPHTTHLSLTLVDLAGNLSSTLPMIQLSMTALICTVNGIEHGHLQDRYVNGYRFMKRS